MLRQMPINLDRAEKLGSDLKEPVTEEYTKNLEFANLEVLNINKIPFHGISFLQDEHYLCPFCHNYTLKAVINWMCTKCNSRVILWKTYHDEVEKKHDNYDYYINGFYDKVDRKVKALKKKMEAQGHKWQEEENG